MLVKKERLSSKVISYLAYQTYPTYPTTLVLNWLLTDEMKLLCGEPPCTGVDAIQPWKTTRDRKNIYLWSDNQLLREKDGQMIMNDISTRSILHNIYLVLEKSVSPWQNANCYSSESDVKTVYIIRDFQCFCYSNNLHTYLNNTISF